MGMLWLILGSIALLVAIASAFAKWEETTHRGDVTEQRVPIVFSIGVGLLGLLLIFISLVTVVQAKNVGVLTTFGKVSERTLEPGLHLKLPWQKVAEIDGTIQTDEYNGDDCIYVRIGDGSRSCVTITNRWQVNGENANTIYSDFRSDDPTQSLRAAVVSTQLKAAIQEVMGAYNPVAQLQTVEGEQVATADLNFAPDYDQVARDIRESMDRRVGNDPLIKIEAITISYISLSETTQKKIDEFIAEVARTRIAAQQVETNRKVAEANRELSESISNDPNVLVSRCFDLVAEGKKPGFSCWPLSGAPTLTTPVR